MYGIFTYIWVIYGVNVGTVNIPMEHMGYIVVFKCESYVQKHLLTSNNIEDHLEGIRESGLAQSRKRNSQKDPESLS